MCLLCLVNDGDVPLACVLSASGYEDAPELLGSPGLVLAVRQTDQETIMNPCKKIVIIFCREGNVDSCIP